MFTKRLIQLCSLAFILSAGLLVSCNTSADEQVVASVTLTALTSTLTEIPPTLTPSPSPAPTYTPTPEPQIVMLRGAKGCEREQDIIADNPIKLHYGVWGSVGKVYAEGSWDLLEITLTMDGEEIEGEKQPVSADLVIQCGLDVEDSYWIFYIADIDGIPPGAHYLEVTYYANGVIEDGFGQNHGPGTILTHSYYLNSVTED